LAILFVYHARVSLCLYVQNITSFTCPIHVKPIARGKDRNF